MQSKSKTRTIFDDLEKHITRDQGFDDHRNLYSEVGRRIGHNEIIASIFTRYREELNTTNENGMTPLMVVLDRLEVRSTEFIAQAAKLGADLTLCDSQGRTALHVAALKQDYACYDALLKAGADPLAKDEKGNTALHMIVTNGDNEFTDLPHHLNLPDLLRAKNNDGKTALDLAFEAKKLFFLRSVTEELLCSGTYENIDEFREAFPKLDESIEQDEQIKKSNYLVAVIKKGSLSMCLSLIDAWSLMKIHFYYLLLAIDADQLKIAAYFLELDKSLTKQRDESGYTAAHIAASCGQLAALMLLHRYGADLNALKTSDSEAAVSTLHSAAKSNLETFLWLLEQVEIPSADSIETFEASPLWIAFSKNKADIFEAGLENETLASHFIKFKNVHDQLIQKPKFLEAIVRFYVRTGEYTEALTNSFSSLESYINNELGEKYASIMILFMKTSPELIIRFADTFTNALCSQIEQDNINGEQLQLVIDTLVENCEELEQKQYLLGEFDKDKFITYSKSNLSAYILTKLAIKLHERLDNSAANAILTLICSSNILNNLHVKIREIIQPAIVDLGVTGLFDLPDDGIATEDLEKLNPSQANAIRMFGLLTRNNPHSTDQKRVLNKKLLEDQNEAMHAGDNKEVEAKISIKVLQAFLNYHIKHADFEGAQAVLKNLQIIFKRMRDATDDYDSSTEQVIHSVYHTVKEAKFSAQEIVLEKLDVVNDRLQTPSSP